MDVTTYTSIYYLYLNKSITKFFFFFLFFGYVLRFIDIKKGHLSTQGVYKGQIQILQESIKSKIEESDWFQKADNQSKKILKKNNLRSRMDLSESSKHLLFLSLQRHHIKQWGTIIHI